MMIEFIGAKIVEEDGYQYLAIDGDRFWVRTPQRRIKFQKTFVLKDDVVKFVSTKIEPELAESIARELLKMTNAGRDEVIVKKFYKKAVVKLYTVQEDGKYWL